MTDFHLKYVNETYCRVECDPGLLMELSDHLTFFKENYQHDPRYRNRMWDGKIRLVNRMTRTVYMGLAHKIKKFCDERDYSLTWDDQFYYDDVSEKEVTDFLQEIGLPDWLDARDYQVDSIVKCLRSKRRTLLSPTSSGKSFMIYAIGQWYQPLRKLIIVPRIGLVKQFTSDLREYGFEGNIVTSVDGDLLKLDLSNADYVITTWQSLNNGKKKMPKQWYKQFEVVFGDEAHGAKAKSLIQIFECMDHVKYRFGTTGTLHDDKLNNATIEGLFGPAFQSITTREMIDQGYAPDIDVKCIVFRYPEHVRKEFNKKVKDKKTGSLRYKSYHEEVDFIVNYERRNKFIKNLALSLEGNKLIFFRKIEHGELIAAQFENEENVFYIDGTVNVDEREDIRKELEKIENAVLIASLGTTSTGISIKRLNFMILGSPTKAKITLLQSIGRMLRKYEGKVHITVFDLVDDLSHGKRANFAMEHFIERVKIYSKECFPYKIYKVGLK